MYLAAYTVNLCASHTNSIPLLQTYFKPYADILVFEIALTVRIISNNLRVHHIIADFCFGFMQDVCL